MKESECSEDEMEINHQFRDCITEETELREL